MCLPPKCSMPMLSAERPTGEQRPAAAIAAISVAEYSPRYGSCRYFPATPETSSGCVREFGAATTPLPTLPRMRGRVGRWHKFLLDHFSNALHQGEWHRSNGIGMRRGFAPGPDPTAEPLVRFDNVSRRFGDIAAVDRLSLDIYRNEFFALLGPSGCGKTTLLRLLAGFEKPDEARIILDCHGIT